VATRARSPGASGLAAVGFQDGIVGRQVGDQAAGHGTVRAGGQREPGVGAFAFTRQQAGVAEQLKVAGEAGLRLAKNLGELGNAEGAPPGESEEAETGGLRGGAERGEQRVHGESMT